MQEPWVFYYKSMYNRQLCLPELNTCLKMIILYAWYSLIIKSSPLLLFFVFFFLYFAPQCILFIAMLHTYSPCQNTQWQLAGLAMCMSVFQTRTPTVYYKMPECPPWPNRPCATLSITLQYALVENSVITYSPLTFISSLVKKCNLTCFSFNKQRHYFTVTRCIKLLARIRFHKLQNLSWGITFILWP